MCGGNGFGGTGFGGTGFGGTGPGFGGTGVGGVGPGFGSSRFLPFLMRSSNAPARSFISRSSCLALLYIPNIPIVHGTLTGVYVSTFTIS